MEKVTINNKVVLMRKFVKQAKIRAINGYTKEIRKLQNRKGTDDATSKFKRKAERLLAKVAILRKIHPDAVSRKALAKEKDWQAVLKEKNIPLEDQCYALLANYAAVQIEVEKFHKKYWDLVPKIPTFFKDWEEKSKDPMTKQEKKKAKQLRKIMKNVKLDKNNPNAIPIGSKNDTNANKNNILTNENAVTNANVSSKITTADCKQSENELSTNQPKPMSSTVALIKETSNNTTKGSKVVKGLQKKSQLQVQHKQLKPAAIHLNKREKMEDGGRSSDADDSYKIAKEVNSDEELNSEEEEINSEEEANSEELNSEEEEVNSGEDVKSIEERYSDKEKLSKCPLKFKFSGTTEIKNNEDLNMSSENGEDSCSENSDLEENKDISENEVTEAIKEKFNGPKPNTNVPKPKNSQDIRSRLQALADNKLKPDMKWKWQKKTNSSKPVQENKAKAVAMLNLNELLGLDEFLVEKTNNTAEETSEIIRKKDSFFLGKGGEVISESEEEEDSPNTLRANDKLPFKKKKADDFAKHSNRDSSKKRSSSQNSRSSFREFPRNERNSNFEDGNNSFKNRAQRRFDLKNKGFQNKSFGERIPPKQFKPNANARSEPTNENNFQKNKSDNTSKKNPVDDKPLHPSWEAKRKLKEAATSKFQGKRIVFDD